MSVATDKLRLVRAQQILGMLFLQEQISGPLTYTLDSMRSGSLDEQCLEDARLEEQCWSDLENPYSKRRLERDVAEARKLGT